MVNLVELVALYGCKEMRKFDRRHRFGPHPFAVVPDEAGLAATVGPLVYAFFFWAVILYFVAFKRGHRHILTQLGGALAFGGIAGNLTDLTIFGGVRNFMLLKFDNPLWSWKHNQVTTNMDRTR